MNLGPSTQIFFMAKWPIHNVCVAELRKLQLEPGRLHELVWDLRANRLTELADGRLTFRANGADSECVKHDL